MKAQAKARFGDESRHQELMGHVIEPEQVADMVCFLASARASQLSGVVYNLVLCQKSIVDSSTGPRLAPYRPPAAPHGMSDRETLGKPIRHLEHEHDSRSSHLRSPAPARFPLGCAW
jgi:hypothetical protein